MNPLLEQISASMIRDRFKLRKMFDRLQKAERSGVSSGVEQAQAQLAVEKSVAVATKRRDEMPPLTFAGNLPINEHREEISTAIRNNQVVVVCGETGSGKSTQLPKICLSAGFGVCGMIGHTQPRRIAARSIASRLAEELDRPLGKEVGFKIRFTDKTDPNSYIKLMTDGILLAETQGDRFLEQYEVIIVDEAHERSLNIDFLLGYIKRLLPKRPELRLIITSATIDAERFSEHFMLRGKPAPIIEVSGRTYPVEVRYQPLVRDEADEEDRDQITGIVEAAHELAAIDRGHILVFLPTEREIRETAKRLRAEQFPGATEVLPLYARLSTAEQNKVFQPNPRRRIVLATNVAESSLTVPGIRYVIDTGTARISRYAPRSKVQRLPIEPISQASANQRAGRCGRVADGICIRLYGEADYESRSAYTTPEIQRTNLASVILQAKALKLGDVERFPFLDLPRPESIRDGYRTLYEIGAVDSKQELTQLGQTLSRLPVDPRIARIVLAADDHNCLPEVLVIAAALEIQDPRERPIDKQQLADHAHEKFVDTKSDFISYLKMWDFYQGLREQVSRSQLRKACKQNFLAYNRMREWTEVHRQLRQLAQSRLSVKERVGSLFRQQTQPNNKLINEKDSRPSHATPNPMDDFLDPMTYRAIHKALLTGFLSGVAYQSGEFEYQGAGGIKFFLWPGSGLFDHKPRWCVVSELVETQRRYGRTVARIDPLWIEPLARHVLKRTYSEPHWHRRQGTVMAFERVTLFGMPIVPRRRTAYGQIDPGLAHELFLRDGLKHEQEDHRWKLDAEALTGNAPRDINRKNRKRKGRRHATSPQEFAFYRHNETVLSEIAKLAAKTRSNEYVVDAGAVYQFYAHRVPDQVYDWTSLRRWFKDIEESESSLRMQMHDLVGKALAPADPDEFPTELQIGSMKLPVDYRFAPGSANDGVTVTVPKDALGHLQGGRTGWLVPGLLETKVIAMIRSLPKRLRRNFIPAPDVARKVTDRIQFGQGDFLGQVVAQLNAVSDESVAPSDFRVDKIDDHLNLNVRVIDDRGNVLAQGRDVAQLRKDLGAEPEDEKIKGDDPTWQRDGVTDWDFEEWPVEVRLARGGIEVPAYPAIQDQQDAVSLLLFDSRARAEQVSRAGIRRLYCLQEAKALRSQVAWLPELNQIAVHAAAVMSADALKSQVRDLMAELAFLDKDKLPRDRAAFRLPLDNSAERIGLATQDIAKVLPKLFAALHEARLACEEAAGSARFAHAVEDCQAQLNRLTQDNFLVETPWRWLSEFPRYFRGIKYRLERLGSSNANKDQTVTHEIQEYWDKYAARKERHVAASLFDEELELFRWMIEEYRVSKFAQPLGTAFAVSAKRLEKQWDKVQG